ncbi:MAG: ParB/RepB/Spo0J family partition protein [Candidatus Kaelpia aquatica]|nr:ParB/RepB/Spo0J family partition protein [Candidatus Kaelpia aquatica]
MEKKRGLGKGISALIPEKSAKSSSRYKDIEIAKITLNPYQPRKEFSKTELLHLQQSIAKDGLLQPIVVVEEGESFKLIAGERRLRSVQSLGWERVAALVLHNIEEVELLRKSLVENVQRANLNPIEEAQAYKRLMDDYGYSLEETAKEVAKDISTVSNAVRLLALPENIQRDLSQGLISPGHARALLMLGKGSQMQSFADKIKSEKLSVREAEKRAKMKKGKLVLEPNLKAALEELQRKIGSKINVEIKKRGGKIEVLFMDNEDLQRIVAVLLNREA